MAYCGNFLRSHLPKPILSPKLCYARELPLVIGDEDAIESNRLGGNEQIVATDRTARLFKPGTNSAVYHIRWSFERQNVERG
jgi:hypothetical protein